MNYLICDLEATSTNPLNAQLLTGHFLYVDESFKILDSLAVKVKPRYWDKEAELASKINGIELRDTFLFNDFKKSMNDIADFLDSLDHCHFVCHANRKIFGKFSSYDYGVLLNNLMYEDLHYKLYRACSSRKIISTHSLAKFTEVSCGHDLKSLCYHYDIKLNNHHTAEDDTLACFELLKKMLPKVNLEDFFAYELGEVDESENERSPKRNRSRAKKS